MVLTQTDKRTKIAKKEKQAKHKKLNEKTKKDNVRIRNVLTCFVVDNHNMNQSYQRVTCEDKPNKIYCKVK